MGYKTFIAVLRTGGLKIFRTFIYDPSESKRAGSYNLLRTTFHILLTNILKFYQNMATILFIGQYLNLEDYII